jgi:hypothetical protein
MQKLYKVTIIQAENGPIKGIVSVGIALTTFADGKCFWNILAHLTL